MYEVQKLHDRVTKQLQEDGTYKDTLVKFKECKTNEARVCFVSQLTAVQTHFTICPESKQKSADLSVKLRNEGNKHYQEGEYQKALDKYNQSVVFAPVESKNTSGEIGLKGDNVELSYALANRSAVFFHQKNYDFCLCDIESAMQNKYPKAMIYKLHERRAKCYTELQDYGKAIESCEKAVDTLADANLEGKKLENVKNLINKQLEKIKSKESNGIFQPVTMTSRNIQFHGPLPAINTRSKVFPCASDAVGVTENDVSEFGLVATQDLLVGETVIVEKAYTSTVLPKFDSIYCHHCCQRVISVYPCQQCSEVVYCSQKCCNESWEMYHSMECICLGTVKKADIGLGYLALKMVMKAGLSTVMHYKSQEKADNFKRSVGFNSNGVYDSKDYNSVYHLVNHSEKRTSEDLLKRALQAYFLLKCLEKSNYFIDDAGQETSFDDKCYVAGHILRHIMMLPCNAHEVSELALKPQYLPESETKEIGSGIYPILSLINHSCDPNVVRHSYGDICVVRALKNIDKGEEILDNYGALYPLTVRSERRSTLEPQYYFTCNCQACIEDWPLYFNIPSDVPKFKCQKCHGPVVIPLDKKTENSFCVQCKQKQDTTDVIVKLHQSQTDYQNVLEQVLRGEKLHEALPNLEIYLQFLYKTVCIPWQDCNNCQEAIKQCYAVQGSCFIAS